MPKKSQEKLATSAEIKRYMGALKEHFDDGVKAIGEQFHGLTKHISEIKTTLNSHTEMIGQLVVDVESLKSDVVILKDDVGMLKSDMGIVKTDLVDIKSELKKKTDYDEFSRLEKRVRILETKARK